MTEPGRDTTDFRPWIDCPHCGGEGFTFECFDGQCLDADVGCDDCDRRCDECQGKGGWHGNSDQDPT